MLWFSSQFTFYSRNLIFIWANIITLICSQMWFLGESIIPTAIQSIHIWKYSLKLNYQSIFCIKCIWRSKLIKPSKEIAFGGPTSEQALQFLL